MSIKNTKKDVASEPGDIVLNMKQNAPGLKSNNQNENFKDNLIITLTKQDQYNEDAQTHEDLEPYDDSQHTVSIPLTELVRLKYLQQNYYTKTEIDNRVKVHIHVVNSVNDLPQVGESNYIYLVAPTNAGPNQDNEYDEYVWTDTNEYELVGSSGLDLTNLVLVADYQQDMVAIDTALSNKVGKTDFASNNANGIMSSTDYQKLSGIAIGATRVIVDSALGNSTNPVQNSAVNTKFISIESSISSLQDSLNDYLLKSEIPDEIWGDANAGFRALQSAETNSAKRQMKLGDYIYDKVYTKTDVDTIIGNLAQIQQNTLSIL